MTLPEVIQALEDRFGPVLEASHSAVVDVASGGVYDPKGTLPALWNSEEHAAKAFHRAVIDYGLKCSKWGIHWAEKPEMRRYQMTMAEMVGRTPVQRLVTERFAVVAKVAIGE